MKTINQSPDMNLENNQPQTVNTENTASASAAADTAKPKKAYSCTQTQLYLICYLAWEYCRANLATFKLFSNAYDSGYIDDKIKQIDAANNLKTKDQRNFQTSKARLALSEATDTFCKNWSNLSIYITNCFKGPAQDINLIAAGSNYYSKARIEEWDSLGSLIRNSTEYVNLTKDELMKNNNMPDTFLATFLSNSASCTDLLKKYKQMSIDKKVETTNKADANNNIYQDMTNMLKAGQFIFQKTPKTREQFVYNNLYKQIKSQSPASIKGYIRDAEGHFLKDVIVKIQKTNLVAITNKGGFFSFNRLAGDNSYMMEVTKPDFIDLYEGVILKPGTAKHLNLTLEAAVAVQPVQMHQQEGEATAQAV